MNSSAGKRYKYIHILCFFCFFVYFLFHTLLLIFLRTHYKSFHVRYLSLLLYFREFSSLLATFSSKDKSIDIERSTTRIFVRLEIIRLFSAYILKLVDYRIAFAFFWAQFYLALVDKCIAQVYSTTILKYGSQNYPVFTPHAY